MEGGSNPSPGTVSGGSGSGGTHPATIRTAIGSDAPVVARLHADQISEGFLSFLGPGFLVRLYRRIVGDPDSFLLVADCQGQVVGFIAGSTDVSGLYRRFLRRDGIPAALSAAPRLLVEWRRAVETLRHGTARGTGTGRGAELLAVAVAPDRQGRGLGRNLVESFLEEVEGRSCPSAHVVVGAENLGAVRLYERCGMVAVDRFELHAGIPSLLMQWDPTIPPPASEPTDP